MKPEFYGRMFLGAIIVRNQMQIHSIGGFAIYFLEKIDKLLMSMPGNSVADHLAVEHAEGGEQGGRPITFVIVCHSPRATFFHQEGRLGAVECLDLTFLVPTQD